MTVTVTASRNGTETFEDVEGFSFYSGRDNNTGKAIARWTKYGEDAWPSTDWINLDPAMLTVRMVVSDEPGQLNAYVVLN